MLKRVCTLGLIALAGALPASAYIGPSAGAGALAVVLGVLASIGLAIVALVWYPLRRMVRRLRTGSEPEHSGAAKK